MKTFTKSTIPVFTAVIVLALSSQAVFSADQQKADEDTEKVLEKSTDKKPPFRHEMRGSMRLKMIDTNEDGRVDLNEYLAHAQERFTKMDLDSDGYLTLEEGRQAHHQMRAKHREMRQQRREARQQRLELR